jgi:hypothetical protein
MVLSLSASINNDDDGLIEVAPVTERGAELSAILLRMVNESTCPDPRRAPLIIRSNDIETNARVSMRCSSEIPAGNALSLTVRRVMAEMVQAVRR